ncbi:MAG: YggT family protein [Spirochaetota bacterium]|nr:YggT family protein [Treponema sp.]HON14410.1 YggT family protein [Treponema sp.]HRS04892.1 YggT family protein [Treponema sp.]
MGILMRILASITTVYMILLFLRIMLTWFNSPFTLGRTTELLSSITDPYLNWFHRFPQLRTELMDFSPVAALAVLALVNNIFLTIAVYGRITLGIILSMLLSSVWSAIAFVLSFFIVILVIRFIAYTLGSNNVHPIWRAIDALSKPMLYRVNRLIFRDRLVTYKTGIFTTVVVLLALRILGAVIISLLSNLLIRLPF